MTEGEFPFRGFTMRSEGYDRDEVDAYVGELQSEIAEQRRALAAATHISGNDIRLHDPEGAVTRTLAIAQETADRVLHDAQVDADGRRAEADEHATVVVADADERAARLLGDIEAQAAEVREQGLAAARSAIQVERDKATAELAHVRRVRDDLRTEAVELKSSLDRYRSQAREASDSLAVAAAGPLMSVDLPDFIDDDVALAGISSAVDSGDDVVDQDLVHEDDVAFGSSVPDDVTDAQDDGAYLHAVDDIDDSQTTEDDLADVISIDADGDDDAEDSFGGTFLAEVRAAAEDVVTLAPENDDSDRFLAELRGIADDSEGGLDSDVADRFFDDEK